MSPKSGTKKDLFSQFSDAQSCDAKEIVAKFRDRHHKTMEQPEGHCRQGMGMKLAADFAIKLQKQRQKHLQNNE